MTKKRKVSRRRRTRRRVSGNPSFAPAVVSGARRSKHVKRRRKRSKVGEITGSEGGDMLLGAVLGVGAAAAIDKFSPLSAKMNDGLKVVVGGTLVVVGGKKSPLAKGAGIGLAAAGVSSGLHTFGILKGVDDFMHGIGAGSKDELVIEMNGVDINSTKLIAGTNMELPSVVSGEESVSGNGDMSGQMPSVVQGMYM